MLPLYLYSGLATLGIKTSLVTFSGANTRNKQGVLVFEKSFFILWLRLMDDSWQIFSPSQPDLSMKGMVITDEDPVGGSSVLQLLRSRHQCNKYISTISQSQQIIKRDGMLFGPGKANAHVESMEPISL